jgi:hypothetical protein
MISSLDDPLHCGGSCYRMPIFSAADKAHSVESALGLLAARAAGLSYRRRPRQAMIGHDAQRSDPAVRVF